MKKKIIIIAIIIFLLLALGVGGYFIFGNKDKKDDKAKSNTKSKTTITITFDADGGTEVEPMKVKKGEKFELPKTDKKGYFFQGWFDGDVYYSDEDTDKLEKDITLKALWANPDTPEDDVELKVVFDSKGGSKVKDMTFKCSDGVAILKNLPKSKKDTAEFMSWEDKNGKSILDGAKIMCDGSSMKLYAIWNNYTCKDGTLSGKKCTISKEPTKSCPSGSREDGEKCVTLSDYNKGERTCPKVYIEGHDYSGTKLEAGTTFCLYAVYESITDQTTCEKTPNGLSRTSEKEKHYAWYSGKCYKAMLQNYETTCGSGYSYFTSADLLNKFGAHNNGGCYKTQSKTLSCETGYDLKDSKCIKTVDAELEN